MKSTPRSGHFFLSSAILVTFCCLLSISVEAQTGIQSDSVRRAQAALRARLSREFIDAQLEPSYVTVGGPPFNIKELGNAPSALFEGMIVPHIALFRPDSGRFALFVTPKVIARQLTLESVPVRTPSFMPRGTLYVALNPLSEAVSVAEYTNLAHFLAVTISHHSNGQENPTFLADSLGRRLDLKSGEFSTNYAELSYNRVVLVDQTQSDSSSGYTFVSLGLRSYQRGKTTAEFRDTYGLWRFLLRSAALFGKGAGTPTKYRMDLNGQVLFGGDIEFWNRIVGSFDVGFRPSFFDDFWLFVGYYAGQDYYNIHALKHRLHTFRVGLIGSPQSRIRTPR